MGDLSTFAAIKVVVKQAGVPRPSDMDGQAAAVWFGYESGSRKRASPERQGRIMSELVESALRLLLRSHRRRERIVALPTFRSGGTLVDIANREALYHGMEGH
jgi:hypothetical protein